MFKWLTNIIKKFRPKRTKHRSEYDDRIRSLSQKSEQLKQKVINTPSIEWFNLSAPHIKQRNINIFGRYSFKQVITLRLLKEERIKKENARINEVKKNIHNKLSIIDAHLVNEKLQPAENIYNEVLTLKPTIPNETNLNDEIAKRARAIHYLSQILREREAERLRKIEEERKRKEQEERRRQEEIAKRERERRERELREKREREERELAARRQREAEENRKREEKRKELEIITAHTKNLKPDKESIATILRQNHIYSFYHFTDESNLKSIKEHGGLMSWYYCEHHSIDIPLAGGDDYSKDLDRLHGLQDYVRLSFCDDHPMAFNVYNRSHARLVLLTRWRN